MKTHTKPLYINLANQIKKLTDKQIDEFADKLCAIESRNMDEWQINYKPENFSSVPIINVWDIQNALTFCIYHFTGGLVESVSDDEMCPCSCYCESCEMIPESEVLVKMQEIGQTMTEENVMNEFVEKHGKYIEEINGR